MMFTQRPYFKYWEGDWVKESGIPEHHLRILYAFFDDGGNRWYQTYDTTLEQRYSDYRFRWADELEAKSVLVERAENHDHLQAIFARCEATRLTPYSVPARWGCHSLQRYLQTGREEDRWCPQVWTGIGVVAAVAFVATLANQKQALRSK